MDMAPDLVWIFLSYVNEKATRWFILIRVLYGTAKWQVGYSRQQNGSYKMFMVKYKKEIFFKKDRLKMTLKLKTSDVIPLINRYWMKSFARVDTNMKAI